jgi:hypothetical protein
MRSHRGEKAAFIICNVTLALAWLHYLVHLIRRWNYLATNIRYDAGALLMFFSFLWLMLIREKRNVFSLLMAGAVFMAAYEIVRAF